MFNATKNNISVIVKDNFIGGGIRNTWRKPLTPKVTDKLYNKILNTTSLLPTKDLDQ
jgi:hypothetical protein